MKRPISQAGQLPFEFSTVKEDNKPTVYIHKNGPYLLFKPNDPIAANILREMREACPGSMPILWTIEAGLIDAFTSMDKVEIWRHLSGNILEHPICKMLAGLDIQVEAVPTLANYIKKEWRKQQREDTPYPTPVRDVTNTLFERSSIGTNLRCIKDYADPGNKSIIFKKNSRYLVMASIGNGENVVRISTTPLANNEVLKDNDTIFKWSSFHPEMEEYFDDSDEEEAKLTVQQAYPELVAAMRKKIDAMGYSIYEHNAIDASMEALKRGVLNCKLMRLSKTREAITIVNLWQSKKIAIFGSQNVRLAWVKEFGKIGITDFVMVDKLSDLDKPGRFYLMKYGWVRQRTDAGSKAKLKYQNYLRASVRKVTRKVSYNYKPVAINVYQHNPCPHCESPMERFVRKISDIGDTVGFEWTYDKGYICRNTDCSWKTDNRKKKGAAWSNTKVINHKGGTYIDYGLAAHANCPEESIKGRMCTSCGQTDGIWIPQVTKRFKKNFSSVIVDEIHNVKDRSSLTAEAVYRMRGRRRIGLTGTLLSNSAMDAYWIMHWVIGGPRNSFPYSYKTGEKQFENRFCEHAVLEKPTGQIDSETGEEIKKTITRRLPYMKNAKDWWTFASPKILRRNYSDPLYMASLEKAGTFKPNTETKILRVPMVPKQIEVMLEALKNFKSIYEKAKADATAANQEINKTFVMSQMTAMRIIATVPQFINKKFDKEVYSGVPGGGKAMHIINIAKEKIAAGEKVVILSDFIEMQKCIAEELKGLGVVRFDTSWDDDERTEIFQKLEQDPAFTGIVAGPRAVSEALDFSWANTAICCDVLWAPATQSQAWSRILAPISVPRNCEIYIVLSQNSIDEHMYNVFYSKLQMAEQAMDHRTINRRAMEINYQWFAERVIEEENNLLLQISSRGDERDDVSVFTVAVAADTWQDRD